MTKTTKLLRERRTVAAVLLKARKHEVNDGMNDLLNDVSSKVEDLRASDPAQIHQSLQSASKLLGAVTRLRNSLLITSARLSVLWDRGRANLMAATDIKKLPTVPARDAAVLDVLMPIEAKTRLCDALIEAASEVSWQIKNKVSVLETAWDMKKRDMTL
jgi:hypothetical protein